MKKPDQSGSMLHLEEGAKIGGFGCMASAVVTAEKFFLKAMFTRYEFTPDQIVEFKVCDEFLLSGALQILHTRADYPEKIIFGTDNKPKETVEKIGQAGFVPRGRPEDLPGREGSPLRWQTFVLAILLGIAWNGACILDYMTVKTPGQWLCMVCSLIFLLLLAARNAAWMQGLILKKNRHIGEIGMTLNFLILLTGFFTLLLNLSLWPEHESMRAFSALFFAAFLYLIFVRSRK